MKVTTILANIRYSKSVEGGAWKTVELGAEAVVASLTEDWQEAQVQLYAELSQQLKALWGNGNGHHAPEATEAESEPAQALEHWCPTHETEFRKHENGKAVWYSHKVGDTGWCREK